MTLYDKLVGWRSDANSKAVTGIVITFIVIIAAMAFMTFNTSEPLIRYIAPMIGVSVAVGYTANRQGRSDQLGNVIINLPNRVLNQRIEEQA